MNTEGNTILITGGATGIGFSLAQDFVKNGNRVIICGRREARLNEAKRKLSQIETIVCDVTKESDRQKLFTFIKSKYPELNILINNAGIQRMVNLKNGPRELKAGANEINTDLLAPIYLSAHFIPLLVTQKNPAIMNVSSGLGFIPIAAMPVYCAAKAGLHLFTVSLRYQLKDTPVKVFEIIPPAVNTELGRDSTTEEAQEYQGIPPEEVSAAVLKSMAKNEYEIIVGEAKRLVAASRGNGFEEAFQNINRW